MSSLKSSVNHSGQTWAEKETSGFWKTIKTNIKLQHQAPPINPISRNGNLPLSFDQERLWFFEQLQPGSSIHNLTAAFRLTGSLDVTALEQSLVEIVQRHEILRTTFPSVDGQPVQVISAEVAWNPLVVDLRELPETEREAEVSRLATEDTQQPFDLAQGLSWRVTLLRLTQEKHVLLRTMHHIVFDGWSASIFFRELAILYEAFSRGKPSPLPELPIQYADFAVSQRSWLQGEVLESLLDYWKQQLSGSIPALELPIDHPRPAIPTYQGATQSFVLSKNLTTALKKLSEQEGVSLFVTLLTAFKTLLHRYTGQEDIILCSPVAGRNRSEIKKLIGYFNNIVVMRTDLSGNPNFRELMSRVSQVTLGAYEHQNLPFQKLADFPNLVRPPLNRGMFALQNTPFQPLMLADVTVTPLDVTSEASNFDLYLSMKEKEEKLSGVLYYKTDLFEVATITQLLKHFEALLDSFVTNPDQHIEDLPFYKPTEPLQLSNQTAVNVGQKPTHTFVAPCDELEFQLTQLWEKVLGKKEISIKNNFFELGGHSLLAVRLFTEIEKIFGRNLPLATLFQTPTIEEFANIFRQQEWSAPWQALVAIQPRGSKLPLFCIHPFGGNVLYYRTLAYSLGEDQPVYGLQAVGLDGKQAPYKRFEDMAAHYIREIRTFQPSGPYLLAGHSSGGVLAFEIAQQLVKQGQRIALLALLDAHSPQVFRRDPKLLGTLYIHLRNLVRLKRRDKLIYIQQRAVWLQGRIARKIAEKLNRGHGHPLPENSHPYTLIQEAFVQAAKDYVPQVYPDQAILFRTRHQISGVNYDPQFGWGSLVVGGLEIHDVPGLHLTMLEEPHVQVLAEKLRVCIDKALQDVSEDHSSEPKK